MIRRLLDDQKDPKKIAVIQGGRGIPYGELQRLARGIQTLLPRGRQENVAILLPNGGGYAAALWGVIQAGMTALPLNPAMTGHEILPLLLQARVGTVITLAAYRGIFQGHPMQILCVDEIAPAPPEQGPPLPDVDGDAPMLLLGTSGTTGKSKIVQLTEKNVEACVLGYLAKLRFDGEDAGEVRYILAAPFCSAYGMMILSACLMRSFPLVVLDAPFTLEGLYRMAEKHRITHYEGGESTILLMKEMAGRPIPYDIRTLKYFGFGGGKVSGETIGGLHREYPDRGFYQGYGMTEAAPLITKHPQGRLTKTDSVGTPINGVELAILTGEGIAKAPHTPGEILVKGPNVMPGYLHDAEETNRVLKNGTLHTGDMGYLDEQGYLYICGRKKNLIIVRGFNVYPEEVEACIRNSQLAKDCHVYGREDGYGGEMVCADVVPAHPRISVEDIRAYCGTHLAEYKRPRRITLCESVQKNAAGKTARR